MPIFRVNSPDGAEYEVNAPDGATETDAIDYVKNNMSSMTPVSQIPQEPQKNVVGDILSKRANELADNIVSYNTGDITAPELGLRFIGKAGAGTANDILGAGVNAAIPDIVKQRFSAGANKTAEAINSTRAGESIGDSLLKLSDFYKGFSEKNPRLMANAESFGNIATFVPTAQAIGKAANQTVDAVGNAARGVEGLSNAYSAKYPVGSAPLDPINMKVVQPISDDMASVAARNAYKDVEMLGGQFTPSLADDAYSLIQQSKIKPFAGEILTKQDKLVNRALADYDKLAGKALTLDDYKRLDSSLGDKAAEAWISGRANEGRVIAGVQDKIRDLIKPGDINNKYISGSREGIDALTNDAIPLWSAQSKLADIQKIVERAQVMDNPTTAVRTGFRNLMMSKRFKTYSPDVQKLIVKAAKTGTVDDLLGVVGSRLNQIAGASIGGAPGFAVSSATSAGARGLRDALRYQKADRVVQGLLEPVRGSIEKYGFMPVDDVAKLTMQEIAKMPPAQQRAALAQLKAIKQSPLR